MGGVQELMQPTRSKRTVLKAPERVLVSFEELLPCARNSSCDTVRSPDRVCLSRLSGASSASRLYFILTQTRQPRTNDIGRFLGRSEQRGFLAEDTWGCLKSIYDRARESPGLFLIS